LFESATENPCQYDARPSNTSVVGITDILECPSLSLRPAPQAYAAEGERIKTDLKTNIADCFLRLANHPTFGLDRLSRYEHLLWRQARQIVFTLESLRRRKPQLRRSSFPFSFRRREPGDLSEKFR
ncbi:MAG: hypothetical protein ACHP7O_14030, partial [Burkholderiales bacterium]